LTKFKPDLYKSRIEENRHNKDTIHMLKGEKHANTNKQKY